MKREIKRLFAMVTVLALMFCLLPAAASAEEPAETTAPVEIEEITEPVETANIEVIDSNEITTYVANHTQAEAIAYVKSLVGSSIDLDGAYGAQCVDLILAYYDYLGVPRASGNGADYATNLLPSGWQRIQGAAPQVGDILVYGASSGNQYGHVAIYESDYSTYHQNFNAHSYVEKVTSVRYNGFTNPYWGVIRPDFTPAPTTMSWTEVSATPTQTDARVSVKAVPNISGSFGETGIILYNALGKTIGQKSESADASARTFLNIWYNITEETGAVLAPGHTYSYQFYTYFNGVRYDSPKYNFTTLGNVAHNYGSWSTQTAATCTAEGKQVRTCSICGNAEYQSIAVKSHTEVTVKGKAATCTATGLTDGKKCSVCGEVLVAQEIVDALNHDFGPWMATAEPTCTAGGEQRRDCTRCDEYETEMLPAFRHTEVTVKGKAATCTETGLTDGKKCSVCGTVTVKQETIAAKGHSYDNDRDAVCNVCGHTRTVKVETIPIYRLYNPYTLEHLFTSGAEERDSLASIGWDYEGVAWKAPTSGIPVHRLYNPYSDGHFYTVSQDEVDSLLPLGWKYDGVVSYGASKEDGVPIYRLFNPYEEKNYHHYTISMEECEFLVSLGWKLEGVAWYGAK